MERVLNHRQTGTILNLLTSSTVEEACRKSGVSKSTVYAWLKDTNFKEELERQRDVLVKSAFNRLKGSVTKAVDELIKLLNSPRPDIRRLASKDVIDYTLKSIEIEDLEQRLNKLEKIISEKEK